MKTINHLKFKTLNRLEIGSQRILFNGTELSYRVYPLISDAIAALRDLKDDPIPESGCGAGTYTHSKKRGTKKTEKMGCLDSERTLTLMLSLKRLELGIQMSVLP